MSENSSNIDPSEIGNTKQSQQSPSLFFTLTVKANSNSSISSNTIRGWCATHCSDATWQKERGESGYEHWQIAIKLLKKNRCSWLKRHFKYDAHIERTRNIEAAYNYCSKEDTRIEGPYFYPEPVEEDEDEFMDVTPYEWQSNILEIIKEKPNRRTVNWFWEPKGNVGKSVFAKHLILKFNAFFAQGCKKDVFHAYNKQRIVVLDIPRTQEQYVSYETIESIKNGLLFSGKYQSVVKTFSPPHLFIFANFPPDVSKLSEDRWNIVEIS